MTTLVPSDPIRGNYFVEPNTNCWLWTGTVASGGYGRIKVGGKTIAAHRLSWMRAHGPIPDGLLVCHKCDTPPCINPDHLFLGTDRDNSQDALKKGRLFAVAHQGNAYRAKLDEGQVKTIREATGTQAAIGARFGVSAATVSRIKSRQRWGRVT